MNRLEKDIYSRMTGGKARSRRSIRKLTTGAERSTTKTWIKANRLAVQTAAQAPEGEQAKESAPVVAPAL